MYRPAVIGSRLIFLVVEDMIPTAKLFAKLAVVDEMIFHGKVNGNLKPGLAIEYILSFPFPHKKAVQAWEFCTFNRCVRAIPRLRSLTFQ